MILQNLSFLNFKPCNYFEEITNLPESIFNIFQHLKGCGKTEEVLIRSSDSGK